MKNTIVSIVPLSSYEPQSVKLALTSLLKPFGGIESLLNNKNQAVIKPNFLMPKPEKTAVCTNPEIIRATAKLLKNCGVKNIIVTDSPGMGTARKIASKLGLQNDETFTVEDTNEVIEIDPPKTGLQKLRLSKTIAQTKNLINVAKAKTHGQMIITAAVKNTFGAIVGLEKAQWHYRIGRDPKNFAELIVYIHQMVAPKLNILDAVIAMEGNGPGSGTPRQLGLLMASTNAHAVDYILCKIWDINPAKIYTLEAAKKLGVLPKPNEIKIVGPSIDKLRPSAPWKMASPKMLQNIIGPQFLIPVFNKLMTLKPQIEHKNCTTCKECVKLCAAKAMSVNKNGQIKIDEKKCISCFCCQEMCPQGAIKVKTGLLSKILKH